MATTDCGHLKYFPSHQPSRASCKAAASGGLSLELSRICLDWPFTLTLLRHLLNSHLTVPWPPTCFCFQRDSGLGKPITGFSHSAKIFIMNETFGVLISIWFPIYLDGRSWTDNVFKDVLVWVLTVLSFHFYTIIMWVWLMCTHSRMVCLLGICWQIRVRCLVTHRNCDVISGCYLKLMNLW